MEAYRNPICKECQFVIPIDYEKMVCVPCSVKKFDEQLIPTLKKIKLREWRELAYFLVITTIIFMWSYHYYGFQGETLLCAGFWLGRLIGPVSAWISRIF